ncbi:unnamed protein product, partial [Brassica rapa subsp. trilocularis]
WKVTSTRVNTKPVVAIPKKKNVTLIGYYCLKWIFGYYCLNPSCILQSESVNGTN